MSKLRTLKSIEYLERDELINHIKENNITNQSFHTVGGKLGGLIVYDSEHFEVYGEVSHDSVFPVEVEEMITLDTIFRDIVEVYKPSDTENNCYTVKHGNKSIHNVQSKNTKRIYVLINEKLELIWDDK